MLLFLISIYSSTQRTCTAAQFSLNNPAPACGQLQRMGIYSIADTIQETVSCCGHAAPDNNQLRVQQINHIRQPESQQLPVSCMTSMAKGSPRS